MTVQLFHYDKLGSTHAEAKRLYETGIHAPFWVQADSQSAGRGRRGRDWTSPRGNFYATLCYRFDGPAAQAACLSFAAAVAVCNALDEITDPSIKLQLKWPNDVLVRGRKLAGILLERHADIMLIGIGLNLTTHPSDESLVEDGSLMATHLSEHVAGGEVPSARALLPIMSEAFQRSLSRFETLGFGPIRQDWLARAIGIPGPVRVRLPADSFTGQAIALCENGALRVGLDNGTFRDVHAGDVFFGVGDAVSD